MGGKRNLLLLFKALLGLQEKQSKQIKKLRPELWAISKCKTRVAAMETCFGIMRLSLWPEAMCRSQFSDAYIKLRPM